MKILHYVLVSDNPVSLELLIQAGKEREILTEEERALLPLPKHIKIDDRFPNMVPLLANKDKPDLVVVHVDSNAPETMAPSDYAFAFSAFEFYNKEVEVRCVVANTNVEGSPIGTQRFNPRQKVQEAVDGLKPARQIDALVNAKADTPIPQNDDPVDKEDALDVFNWPEASKRLQNGEAVRRLSWGFNEFISVTFGQVVTTEKLWSAHNRRAASMNGGVLQVEPYYTRCDGQSMHQWFLTYADEQANDWVEWDSVQLLHSVRGNHFTGMELNFDLYPHGLENAHEVYSVLQSPHPITAFIGDFTTNYDSRNVEVSTLTEMKSQLTCAGVVGDSVELDRISDTRLINPHFISYAKGTFDEESVRDKLQNLIETFASVNVIVLKKHMPDDFNAFSPLAEVLTETLGQNGTWASFSLSDFMSNNL